MTLVAAVLHGPNDLRVEEVAEPDLPRGGLVVRIGAVGICGSDVRNWRHGSPRLRDSQVIGHEMAGYVEQSDSPDFPVGTHVAVCPGMPCMRCRTCKRGHANLCPNRRVFGYDLPGGMAEALAVPAEALACKAVVRLPDTLPIEFAPLAEPLHTVLNGQARARVDEGDSVLVLGLGAIGILHLAVARSRGASLTLGVDPNGDRARSACEILGPDVGIAMDSSWTERALDLTDGQGWDVVVIANNAPPSLSNAMKLVGPSGRILAFAGANPDAPMREVDLNRIHYRQVEIIGSFAGTPSYFQAAVEWLAQGHLPLGRLVTARLALVDAIAGFESVERGEGLKTMLMP